MISCPLYLRRDIMQVNWSAVLTTPKGETLKEGSEELTLGALAYQLLLLNDPEAKAFGADKLRNAKLARKVVKEKEISLDEAKIIKDLVGKYGSPAAVLAVDELLDPPHPE
jgi:hypothetical protein